ncbi:hypothetical protein SAMN05421736_103274 [Evansella caseinilytica]|uniref:Peptidyl-prolyl cis-trans isomerase n=1 Tax=Evansella caseinilytica TaxID=1503961 RepID=A0A1H3MM88_9BACI|nr:hypothetical protein [Evansella caseinilytica]SDY77640.1 hypothetical protein SAMN05421736_103274 [Evansella caseinilytica]
MSNFILTINGSVKYTITIDPGVWIFDERKVDLDTYFSQERVNTEDLEVEKLAKAWSLHRQEGAAALTNGNRFTGSKKELTEKSFGIPLYPFINNAAPLEVAATVVFKRKNGEDFRCSLDEAKQAILGFSHKGKPLLEDGPVHFYFGNGTNKDRPVKNIIDIVVE